MWTLLDDVLGEAVRLHRLDQSRASSRVLYQEGAQETSTNPVSLGHYIRWIVANHREKY